MLLGNPGGKASHIIYLAESCEGSRKMVLDSSTKIGYVTCLTAADRFKDTANMDSAAAVRELSCPLFLVRRWRVVPVLQAGCTESRNLPFFVRARGEMVENSEGSKKQNCMSGTMIPCVYQRS